MMSFCCTRIVFVIYLIVFYHVQCFLNLISLFISDCCFGDGLRAHMKNNTLIYPLLLLLFLLTRSTDAMYSICNIRQIINPSIVSFVYTYLCKFHRVLPTNMYRNT